MRYFDVKGMTCDHCARAVTTAIQAQDPQAQVTVELAAGKVGVQSALATEQVLALIQQEGYAAQAR
ncbi:heavy-metal-associated domain-containing protein [Pseudomonas typographi]|uniref:Heavy-metal-associated domain-containing protein n=1 Tax=Pseudomonas typographi TaxID=2715964 RepID=A0ABR7Z837_9PSED|nr:heavy-metal-associated domain-containing protein [Pseudomonas typographi]MBD1554366.1 heavy-metal-associated domain-containing protein [Pseudomonas typographi]MBD1589430.1 heavy-metal-associated domain-containing protein [Pseudomonas typographi]MBD1601491.1 heavy-metal-associated domain-containing protein [Pseudomonas typographi]